MDAKRRKFHFGTYDQFILMGVIITPIVAFFFDVFVITAIWQKFHIQYKPGVMVVFTLTTILLFYVLFMGTYFIDEYTFKHWQRRKEYLAREKECLRQIEVALQENRISKDEAAKQMKEIIKYFYPSMLRDPDVASWAEKYCPQYRARTDSIRKLSDQ